MIEKDIHQKLEQRCPDEGSWVDLQVNPETEPKNTMGSIQKPIRIKPSWASVNMPFGLQQNWIS